MQSAHTIRIDFGSAFEMVDVVQVVSDHIGRMVGLDDDGLHWLGVAVRESVINAIKHGNRNDAGKRVALLRAYDKTTGADAGAVEMPARQTGSPMTYQIDGKQFIVLAVSGNDGAELLAYSLP